MPKPTGVRIDSLDPNDGLRAVVALRELADQLEDEHVTRAIETGWSWSEGVASSLYRRSGSSQ